MDSWKTELIGVKFLEFELRGVKINVIGVKIHVQGVRFLEV